ncbi:hypothetical protein BV25DRAFT_298322 [Artomyces pyxidatus]|uniref:Uncharacterized protein n=1 Tax=Artomyces pyxidatus TaxID=48021 RepID=A0ACB8T7X4_9AGAM|nr:hypothetical protein BV25DRAFT_298322 [Artomyces pyxidatus]
MERIGGSADVFWQDIARSRFLFLDGVTTPSGQQYTTDTYRRVDDELAAIHLALCHSRSRRNAMAPISRLSPEILALIFFFLVRSHPVDLDDLEVVKITRICRRWREVAINSAILWSVIPLALDERWVTVMLTRAKGTPTTIFGDPEAEMTKLKVKNLLQHFHNTANFDLSSHQLYLAEADVTRELCLGLSTPAPALKSISMIFSRYRHRVPENLFDKHAPRLRYITLRNVTGFPWATCFATNLVRLDISCTLGSQSLRTDDAPTLFPSVDEILDFLDQSPTLEELFLVRCFEPFRSGRPHHPIVELPCLTICDIGTEYLTDSLYIIQHLEMPLSAELTLVLGVVATDRPDEIFGAVFATPLPHIRSNAELASFGIAFICDDNYPTYEEDLHVTLTRFSDSLYGHPEAILHMCIQTAGARALMRDSHRDWIQSFYRSLPAGLGNLSHISVSLHRHAPPHVTRQQFSARDWQEIWGLADEVREVSTDHNAALELLLALSTCVEVDGTGWKHHTDSAVPATDRTFFLPKLSSLVLRELDLDQDVIDVDGQSFTAVELLVTCLTARKLARSPLDSFRLVSCLSEDWKWLERLKHDGVVPIVEWSGDDNIVECTEYDA